MGCGHRTVEEQGHSVPPLPFPRLPGAHNPFLSFKLPAESLSKPEMLVIVTAGEEGWQSLTRPQHTQSECLRSFHGPARDFTPLLLPFIYISYSDKTKSFSPSIHYFFPTSLQRFLLLPFIIFFPTSLPSGFLGVCKISSWSKDSEGGLG